MKENDPLRPLLDEYREELRRAAPSPEIEERLRAAMRQQRRPRWTAGPRAWAAAAAAMVVVGWVAWWRMGPAPAVEHRQEYAESRPAATPSMERPAAPPEPAVRVAPAPKKRVATASSRSKPIAESVESSASPQESPKPVPVAEAEASERTLTPLTPTELPRTARERLGRTAEGSAKTDPVSRVRIQAVNGRRLRIRTTGSLPPPINAFASRAPGAANLAAVVESIGERSILGYLCQGTRQTDGSQTIERWHATDLGVNLLVKTVLADGREMVEEVIEVIPDK